MQIFDLRVPNAQIRADIVLPAVVFDCTPNRPPFARPVLRMERGVISARPGRCPQFPCKNAKACRFARSCVPPVSSGKAARANQKSRTVWKLPRTVRLICMLLFTLRRASGCFLIWLADIDAAPHIGLLNNRRAAGRAGAVQRVF